MLTHEMGVVRAFPGFLFGMSLWAYRRELARLPYADGILLGLVGLFIVGAIVGADQKIMFALTYGMAATALAADQAGSSEERRAGTACVSTCSSRWSPHH